MSFQRIIEPRRVVSWEDFVNSAPGFSVSFDGYVFGRPRYDNKGPHLNLNHHEEVDRLATRSTSGQTYIYIKQGLFQRFRKSGEPFAHLYYNDADQDVCLTDWLIHHSERISGIRSEPLISRLVFAEDALDVTAGAYPFSLDSDLMRDIAWIYALFTDQKSNMHSLGASGMESIIESVGSRIDQYTLGRGLKSKPDDRLEILHQENGWAMIKEMGPYARSRLFAQGTFAFVSYKGEDHGRHRYSYGKMSPFVDFPLEDLYTRCNALDGCNTSDCHGGGNTIGGSPRNSGSGIAPQTMIGVVHELLGRAI